MFQPETKVVCSPELPLWVEAVVRSMVDLDAWGEELRAVKVDDVGLILQTASPKDPGPSSGGRGSKLYKVGVPPEVGASFDLHHVTGWLVAACIQALGELSDKLRVERPILRLNGSAAEWERFLLDRIEPAGRRFAELGAGDARVRVALPAGSGAEAVLRANLGLVEAAEPVWSSPGWAPFALDGIDPPRRRTPAGPEHFDFRGVQYPTYVDSVAGRSDIDLVVWLRSGDSRDRRAARELFDHALHRIRMVTGLDPYVSGLDTEVLWSGFGQRLDGSIVERDRVTTEMFPSADDEAAYVEHDDLDEHDLDGDADEEENEFGPPDRIAIDPDDGHAADVGLAQDGRQYFLTWPWSISENDADDVTYYAALYLFDPDGALMEADVRRLGHSRSTAGTNGAAVESELLDRLGVRTVRRIVVEPFAVERFGQTFGLIAAVLDGNWRVNAMPGDYMEFFPPWDSGIYDT